MTSPVVISERQADLGNNDLATAQTIEAMCWHIREAVRDPLVRATALEVSGAGMGAPQDARNKGRAIWAWCRHHIQFVTDEDQMQRLLGRGDELELLISPSVLLRARVRQGDCDDFTMLVCAMLQALGVPWVIKTFKCDRQQPWRWAHVCAAAVLEDGTVFPLDASHGDYPGWEVPQQDVYESQLWDMNGNRIGETNGMGRTRGLSGYTPDPNWTGTPETTYRGPHAGIYPSRDFTRMYSPRQRGLSAIARGKYRGMGDDTTTTDLFDPSTPFGSMFTSGGSSSSPDYFANLSVDYDAPGPNYIDSVTGQVIDGSTGLVISNPTPAQIAQAASSAGNVPGTSFNLSSFLSQLTGGAAAVTAAALKQPGAQLLANGSVLLPNGTVVNPNTGISSSALLLIGGALLLVLVVAGKK